MWILNAQEIPIKGSQHNGKELLIEKRQKEMKTNLGERLMSSLINSKMPEPAITSLVDADSRIIHRL
jgi:hypothetical protein